MPDPTHPTRPRCLTHPAHPGSRVRHLDYLKMFGFRSISDILLSKMFAYRSILREAPRPAAVRESPQAPWLAVGVVCFGAFMGQLDASIVTITFPAMQRDFGVPVAAVQWVSLVYLLGRDCGGRPHADAGRTSQGGRSVRWLQLRAT
jgi:hypothetical protein